MGGHLDPGGGLVGGYKLSLLSRPGVRNVVMPPGDFHAGHGAPPEGVGDEVPRPYIVIGSSGSGGLGLRFGVLILALMLNTQTIRQ